jgi:DNA-binding transcriptional regulator YhcF (GntR family)
LKIEGAREVSKIASTLAGGYSIELLQELHARGWSSASEVARDLGIHVATAMRKLAELESMKLLKKKVRRGNNVVEYNLNFPRLEIILDFDDETRKAMEGAWSHAEKTLVREKPHKNIVAEVGEEQERVLRLVFIKGRRLRSAVTIMELTELEGRFLWHIPFSSQNRLSVADICRKASIENPLHVAKILEFVKEMKRLGVLEVVR